MKKSSVDLIREEENLTNEIDHIKKNIDFFTKDYNEAVERLECSRNRLRELEAKHKEVCEKLIVVDSTSKTRFVLARPIIRQAFDVIWNAFSLDYPGANYDNYFKKFDDLVHDRYKAIELFEHDWDINDICIELGKDDRQDLAEKIKNFWKMYVEFQTILMMTKMMNVDNALVF